MKGGTREAQRDFQADIFGEPKLPSDPRTLERVILEYANAVIVAARQIDGSQYWGPALRAIGIDMKDYEQRPTAEKLAVILRRARGIGLNLGITTSTRQGFDVDGRRFHKKVARAPAGLGNPRLYSYDFYAEGGDAKGSDTVRAMLTPGEWVIPRAAVQKYGTAFFDAINNMDLRPPRPERVQHFAQGGQVGGEFGENILTPAMTDRAAKNFNVYLNASAEMLFSKENVRRFLIPVLREFERQSK